MKCFIRFAMIAVCILSTLVLSCNYTTKAPGTNGIKTVEVPMFKNNTMYHDLEVILTREIKEAVMRTPGVRVVNAGGDAVISGEILSESMVVKRNDRRGVPATLVVQIRVKASMEDARTGMDIMKERAFVNTQSSALAGTYQADMNEPRELGEAAALKQIAQDIVRQAFGAGW